VADLVESVTFFEQFTHLWEGQRGKRYSGIDQNADQFLMAISKQRLAPNCAVVRYGLSGNAGRKPRRSLSVERKIAFGLEVADALAATGSAALVEILLADLSRRIESHQADKDHLIELLSSLGSGQKRKAKPIFASAKHYVMQKRDRFDDFSSIGAFVESFPGAIVAKELDQIRHDFRAVCEDYVEGRDEDPKVLRSIAEEIEAIASKLDVDVDEFCDPLIQLANELEEKQGSDPEPDPHDWGGEPSVGSENTDEMFENLLREIDERRN
jgi:hypothetical protein